HRAAARRPQRGARRLDGGPRQHQRRGRQRRLGADLGHGRAVLGQSLQRAGLTLPGRPSIRRRTKTGPLPRAWRAVSSAVEHTLHTGGVTSSILVPPTIFLSTYPTSPFSDVVL